jgi:hypothetical protein
MAGGGEGNTNPPEMNVRKTHLQVAGEEVNDNAAATRCPHAQSSRQAE